MRPRAPLLPAVLILLAVVIFGALLFFLSSIFIWNGGPSLQKSDHPLTREQALSQHLGFPFPPSATAIEYQTLADWQVLRSYLRFHVAPAEAGAAVQALIDADTRIDPTSYSTVELPLLTTSGAPISPETLVAHGLPAWWTADNIRQGYRKKSPDVSLGSIIWYDSENSIIYLHRYQ